MKSSRTNQALRKLISLMLVLALAFPGWSAALAEVGQSNNEEGAYNLVEKVDFEDGGLGAFTPSTTKDAEFRLLNKSDASGNHYLSVEANNRSGDRSATHKLSSATDSANVRIKLDWKPSMVITAKNSSHVAFQDAKGKILFRLVKAGGADGEIRYEVGSNGNDLAKAQSVTGVTYQGDQGAWLSAEVNFNFADQWVSFTLADKDHPEQTFSSGKLSLETLVTYESNIASIEVKGNRSSGNDITFSAGLDNLQIDATGKKPPVQQESNVAAVQTVIPVVKVMKGTAVEAAAAGLPGQVEIQLENGKTLTGVPVAWSSKDYKADAVGEYSFTGTLNLESFSGVVNANHVTASAKIAVMEAPSFPQLDGFETAQYTEFDDQFGFTTSGGGTTLKITEDQVADNSSSKLSFLTQNQSGGRVAAKKFDSSIKGSRILVKADWYPGKVNDKGPNHASENGGELKIFDGSNNLIFSVNNTNKAPLSYYAGYQIPQQTKFTNPETWYEVSILIDLYKETVTLKLTDKATQESGEYSVAIDTIPFDSSVKEIRLSGVRTAGNNITWQTYLDNLGVYRVWMPDNYITRVNAIPYGKVYVNQTTADLASIGLPKEVKLTLADDRNPVVTVKQWEAVGQAWNPAVPGVYVFRGTLDVPAEYVNEFGRKATYYVQNRLSPPETARQTEWLDRGVIALKAQEGIFISWRLLADEYAADVKFNVFRNSKKLNTEPLSVTNFTDLAGAPGDIYMVQTLVKGAISQEKTVKALEQDYLSIPMQIPEGGETASGPYTYSVNDASVGDLDGDGEYEIIVKWIPSNGIDSSHSAMTGPTIFDAYKLNGTLLWRINMGLNLTSGAHYNQFLVADFDGDGRSEFLIKTADGTTSYGATNGKFDSSKVLNVIGDPKASYVNDAGHITGGPEYITVFNGLTGQIIDTIDYAFPVGDPMSWGDSFYNRSDRFLAAVAYLDGVKPSAVYGRGYYERTTYVAYSLVGGKLKEQWTFDSAKEGRGGGLGFHNLATADVDNDGFDEIIAGSLTLDQDGSILYTMDGEMLRERGSHGDALHVGAFDPDREGIHVIGVHEDTTVASLEYHDGATGETFRAFNAFVDAGRGLAANITSQPGYEYWGNAGKTVATGGGIYNVQGSTLMNSKPTGLSTNFALYWDGDLLHELLNQEYKEDKNTKITYVSSPVKIDKFNEKTQQVENLRSFPFSGGNLNDQLDGKDLMTANFTKATPALQADILGDWREEVLLQTYDSTELRIYSTTIPTDYRLYTLMHDPVYRNGIAWQNTAYNQPPHISFYLGEDIRDQVLAGELKEPKVKYVRWTPPESDPSPSSGPSAGPSSPSTTPAQVAVREDGTVSLQLHGTLQKDSGLLESSLKADAFEAALDKAKSTPNGVKQLILETESKDAAGVLMELPTEALKKALANEKLELAVAHQGVKAVLSGAQVKQALDQAAEKDKVELLLRQEEAPNNGGGLQVEVALQVNDKALQTAGSVEPVIRVSVPYAAVKNDMSRQEQVAVTYTGADGELQPIYNGRYDANQQAVVFAARSLGVYTIEEKQVSFADTADSSWAVPAIQALAAKGIVTGVSDETRAFGPDQALSRADFVVLLARALDLHAPSASHPFGDVESGSYYEQAVSMAYQLGIASGTDEGLFHPEAAVTRQDMMALAVRALSAAGIKLELGSETALSQFSDRGEVAGYAQEAASTLTDLQLIGGYEGKIHPLKTTSRAEAAVFLHRLYQLQP